MVVVLDATPLTMTTGGLPRYVSELANALTLTFPQNRFLLASDQPFQSSQSQLRGPGNWLERRWWLYGAERTCARAGASLFHGTNFAVPYFARRATVLTVHDLSPWLNRAWHKHADRVRARAPRMIALATMVVTPSETVRRQAMERFKLAADRVTTTPLAAGELFRPVPKPPGRPYFLFVGTLEPRKNIAMAIAAWREVRRTYDVDLVLAGRRRADFAAPSAEPGLTVLGETPEGRLPELYSNAIAVLYPSEYEGFGLPVLEAMQCGACVIASRDAALMEVSGGAAIHVLNAREMSDAMKALLDDPGLRAARSQLSLSRARAFSWEKTARATYAVYREAIARYGR